ncbi:beta-1,3-endoglucanase [Skeletonema marinoi]|uniref:Beta-1,3-endoglucanase n=1 Tax=Skeletonema marinoi TaxID=267567 RepID=A0AAD8YE52_9STRA|nr:beta-1,3-endoglucanase [Skeletonema marinoi]
MVKGYGSTNRSDEQPPPITPPRRNLSASSYETPSRTGGSLPRNQSNSAETTHDSTLRHFLEDVQEQRRGFLNRFFGSDPALPLVCLGLVVGISICAIPAFLYVQYHHHQDVHTIMSGDDTVVKTSAAHSALWGGVPYQKISRAAYGDPVSNFLDESLFHPSLLYQGEGIDITSAKSSVKAQNTDESMHSTIGDDDDRRRLASSSMKPFLRFPFPTGAFWTNLVLLPQTYDGKPKPSTKSQSSYPIVAYPYSFQWSPLGRLQVSYSASRRKIQSNSIQDAFAPDVSIGSVDNIHTRHVVKYDSLKTSGKQNSTNLDEMKHWDTYIVQGSPYVTARYYGLRPELTALSDFTDISCPPTMQTEEERLTRKQSNSTHSNRRRMSIFSQPSSPAATGTSGKKFGVCGISEKSTRQKKVITGVQFVVTTQEGLMWLVFASEPITFEFGQAARRNIKTSMPFQGVIRLALVPPPPTNVSNMTASAPLDMKQLASSSGVKRLIYHAGTFPVGGTVNWSFRSGSRAPLASSMASGRRSLRQLSSSTKENNIGSVTFTFSTMHMSSLESASSSAQMELLMLSLPHHAASISSADKILFNPQDFDLFFRCIKGRMVPVVGSSWTYEEKLTSIGFDDETSIDGIQNPGLSVSTLDQSIRDLILQTVDSDLNINLPVLESGAYGFGKGIARLAQLAIIADSIEGANVHGKHTTAKNVTTAKDDSHVTKPTTLRLVLRHRGRTLY